LIETGFVQRKNFLWFPAEVGLYGKHRCPFGLGYGQYNSVVLISGRGTRLVVVIEYV
jgi:hypothetical protein